MTLKSKTMRWVPWIMLAAVSLLSGRPGFAGSESGGGGDTATELKVDEIRAEILRWIEDGGARELKLPARISYETYVMSMEEELAPHVVVIGSVTPEEEARAVLAGDEELQVKVNGQPKTCRGFVSKKDFQSHILCSSTRFAATTPAEQVRLIHHEYAGLAEVELNVGASSDYEISQQLTDYIELVTAVKLSVKKTTPVILERTGRIETGMILNLTVKEDIEVQPDQFVVKKGACRLLLKTEVQRDFGYESEESEIIKAHTMRMRVRYLNGQCWQQAGWPFWGGCKLLFRLDAIDDPMIRAFECKYSGDSIPSQAGDFDDRIKKLGFTIGTVSKAVK